MQSAIITAHALSAQLVISLNSFVERFYHLTDDSTAHSNYACQFLPNATLTVNHRVVQSGEGIVSLRKSVWSACLSQKHIIDRVIYTQKPSTRIEGEDYVTMEAIIFGTVTTVSNNRETTTVEWAGKAEYLSQNGIDWHVFFYQVYLNTKPKSILKI